MLCFFTYHMSQLTQRKALIFYMLTQHKKTSLVESDLIGCICILYIDVSLKYLLLIINKLTLQYNTIQYKLYTTTFPCSYFATNMVNIEVLKYL